MNLSQFLSTLKTPNVTVDLVDMVTGNTLATIQAIGYSVLEDSIEAREVKQWSIKSLTHISVTLGDAVETEEETEPTNEP